LNHQPRHTLGLVLSRTNYGESDRIVTFLTRDYGKVRAIAKGVRKERAKLAAGVELFVISEIGFVVGRSELATLVSTKIKKSYHCFLNDLNRVNFGFDSLKKLNKITAEVVDGQYFDLAEQLFMALNDSEISLEVITLWWHVNLAQLTGHGLNLQQSVSGQTLKENALYVFDQKRGSFVEGEQGKFNSEHIKLLRLALGNSPKTLMRVKEAERVASQLVNQLAQFSDYHY
jgi:DNA repair protein RecO (recombination protein O)